MLEQTQRSYVRRIRGIENESYWNQLNLLKVFSVERRGRDIIVIYIWCILEGLVPNFQESPMKTKTHIRHGRECFVPWVKQSNYAKVVGASLHIHGATLLNVMKRCIRNMTACSKESFKRKLDSILYEIPDEPQTRRYTSYRRADSNSLLDMIRLSSVGLIELDM